MKKNFVFMFSGQGSQYYGMGQELYFHNSLFREWMTKLNNIIHQQAGFSIVDKLYKEEKGLVDIFDELQYTHLAIFMVEYSLAQVFLEKGFQPDLMLGASLGEFTAAAVAGIITIEEALQIILKQVELVSKYCKSGRMTAVIHNPELYYQHPKISLNSEIAAINYSTHFVISGHREDVLSVEEYLKTKDILFQALPVKYGFHSRNIEIIENDYKKLITSVSIKEPEITLYSCMLGKRIESISPEYFWDIVRKPILFQKTIIELENNQPFNYIDLGPYGTLANFIKQNLEEDSDSRYFSVMTPFHRDIQNVNKIFDLFQRVNC